MKRANRVPLRRLRTFQRQLALMCEALDAAGHLDFPDFSSDDTETARNAATALEHIRGWIYYRENHGKDPIDDTT